jgi:hypothetical protein
MEYVQTGDDNDRKAGDSCIMLEFRICAVLLRSTIRGSANGIRQGKKVERLIDQAAN